MFCFLVCLLWARPTNTRHVLFKSLSHMTPLSTWIMSVLEEIVGHLKPSRSPSDAVPLRLFKEVFPSVLTGLYRALYAPTFPRMLKQAVVKPVIKKPALDPTTLPHVRPTTATSFKNPWEDRLWSFYGKVPVLESFYLVYWLRSVCHSSAFRFNGCVWHNHKILMSPLECFAGTGGRGVLSSGVVEILPGRPTFCVNTGDSMSSCAPPMWGPTRFRCRPSSVFIAFAPTGVHWAQTWPILSLLCWCLSHLLAPPKEKCTFHRNTLQVFHVLKAWIAWKFIKILWKEDRHIGFWCPPPGLLP